MKRVLLIAIIVVGMPLFAIDHGLISGFAVGWNILGVNQIIENDNIFEDDYSRSLSIKMTVGYMIENFRILGEYENTLILRRIDKYSPIQDNYKLEINYTFNNLKIGFYHWCNHPVITISDKRKYLSNSGQRSFYISYYREF